MEGSEHRLALGDLLACTADLITAIQSIDFLKIENWAAYVRKYSVLSTELAKLSSKNDSFLNRFSVFVRNAHMSGSQLPYQNLITAYPLPETDIAECSVLQDDESQVDLMTMQKKREELCTNARMIFAKIVEKYGFSSRQRERLPTQMIPLRPSEDQTTLLCDLMRGEFS